MRRTSVIVIVTFLVGLATGFLARGAMQTLLRKRAHAADLAAIEKAHQMDVDATLKQDPKGLADLWTDDAVRVSHPGTPPTVGKKAIADENEKFHAQYPGFKVLSYSAKYKDLQIEDGMACEWGEHYAQYKLSAEAPPIKWHGNALTVLIRQSDGSWKAAFGIGN